MKNYYILIGLLVGVSTMLPAINTGDEYVLVSVDGELSELNSREVVGQINFVAPSVKAIIVVINSRGGALPDLLAIADALQNSEVPTYAYVKKAVATSVFIAAACDTIVSDEQGIIGGPGIVPREMFVFEDELFAEISLSLSRKLAFYADQSGHDVGVFTAMIDSKQVLIRNGKKWKEQGEILALTAREMIVLSIAPRQWSSVDAFVGSMLNGSNQSELATTLRLRLHAALILDVGENRIQI